ncbi:MAG: 30S ribosomal protein S16 [Acidobacteria bacterium]|nr:MAG: 30S ribosomal protein S16 [Acidobacteriota bacterium]
MLAIRLARQGTSKKPFYRVLLLEKSSARNGRSLEILGTYNPVPNPALIDLNVERIEYWRSHGAQVSDTVANLLRRVKERATAAPAA